MTMSNARIFFAGVGTTILLIGTGFGGGLMLARTAMEPVPPSRETAADRLQPARIILPASAEAAPPPAPPATEVALPNPSPPLEHAQTQVPPPADVRTEKDKRAERAENEKQAERAEKEKQAERAAQRKAEAEERDRRRRYAERKARREAARLKQQHDQQQQDAARQDRPGIMAFGVDDNHDGPAGFFGN
jgi:outer membrane biosynthesis protein TonB